MVVAAQIRFLEVNGINSGEEIVRNRVWQFISYK
jgi:hypothetical protein